MKEALKGKLKRVRGLIMAKKKAQRIIPDYNNKTVEVTAPADKLSSNENAQLAIFIQAGFSPVFTTRPQSDKQKARAALARGKKKDYYLSQLKSDKDKELFESLCAKPYSFMTAKSWFEHRDHIAAHLGITSWDSATDEQREEGMIWFHTVEFRGGKAKPRNN